MDMIYFISRVGIQAAKKLMRMLWLVIPAYVGDVTLEG